MNPSKITKKFFKSNNQIDCPNCKAKDDKSPVERRIDIIGQSAFSEDEDYYMFVQWVRDVSTPQFNITSTGNKTPDGHPIIINSEPLTNIGDLINACILINRVGLKIDEVRLVSDCNVNDCRFRHIIDLEWIKKESSFALDCEYIKLDNYKLNKDYCTRSSTISTTAYPKQIYDFNFLININLRDYEKVEQKIKHTLLLG